MLPFAIVAGLAGFDMVLFLLLDPAMKDTAPLFVPRRQSMAFAVNGTDDDYVDDTTALLGSATLDTPGAGDSSNPLLEQTIRRRVARVLRDPYVLIVFGSLTLAAMNLASLEPTLPFYWLERDLTDSPFALGMVFSAAAAGYLLATPLVAWLGLFINRYLLGIAGLLAMTMAMISMALPTSIAVFAAPLALLGIGMAMTTVSSMPMLVMLVDRRHAGEFALVFALSETSATVGQIAGALGGAFMMRYIQFLWTVLAFAGLDLLYAPVLALVRSVTRERFKIEPFQPGRNGAGAGAGGGDVSAPATPAKPRRAGPLLGGQVSLAALMGMAPPGSVSSTPPYEGSSYPGASSLGSDRTRTADSSDELVLEGDGPHTPPRAAPGAASAALAGGPMERQLETPSRFTSLVNYLLESQAMQGPYAYSAAAGAFHHGAAAAGSTGGRGWFSQYS